MTLIYEHDLNIPRTYMHAKNEVSESMLSKVRAQQNRHTHRQTDMTECINALHSQVVKMLTAVNRSLLVNAHEVRSTRVN